MIPYLFPLIPIMFMPATTTLETTIVIDVIVLAFLLLLLTILHALTGSAFARKLVIFFALIIAFAISPSQHLSFTNGSTTILIPSSLIHALLGLGLLTFTELSKGAALYRNITNEYLLRLNSHTLSNFAILYSSIKRYSRYIFLKLGIVALISTVMVALVELANLFGGLIPYTFIKLVPLLYLLPFGVFHTMSALSKSKRDEIKAALSPR